MTIPDLPADVWAHRDWLLALAPVPDKGLWVDLGCGDGTNILTLAARHFHEQLQLVGLDGHATSIERANKQGAPDKRLVLRHHHLSTRVPVDTATADLAHSQNVLECLGDRETFAREVVRLLGLGGWAMIAYCDSDEYL